MTQFSHTYNRGPVLTESQIQDLGAQQAEAAAPVVMNIYEDLHGNIRTLYRECHGEYDYNYAYYRYVDKAAKGDICADCGNADGDSREEL